MKRILSMLMLASLSCCAFAETPSALVDLDFKAAVEESNKSSWAECKGLRNPARIDRCMEDFMDNYREKGTLRATKPYMEKHYSTLSIEEMKKKLKALKKLRVMSADNGLSEYDRKPGELHPRLLSTEIAFIEKLLAAKQSKGKPTLAEKAEAMGLSNMAERIREATGSN